MARLLLLVLILLLVVACVVAYVIGGRPRVLYRAAHEIVSLVADDQGLLWLELPEGAETPGRLYALGQGADRPVSLCPEPHVTAFAPADERVLALTVSDGGGAVVSVPRSGGEAQTVASLSGQPGDVVGSEGLAFWTERREPILDYVPHVPAVMPRTLIRSAAIDGASPARTVTVSDSDIADPTDTLLGVDGGRLWWLDRFGSRYSGGWAAIRSVPVEGGVAETLVTLRWVTNDALLDDGVLYWTAPSEDAGHPSFFRCVRRAAMPGGEPETLTDWLPAMGQLARADGWTGWASVSGVWIVPERLGPPRVLPGSEATTGRVAIWGGRLYEARAQQDGWSVRRTALTVGGRVLAAVGR
jgi:hypothetical protein